MSATKASTTAGSGGRPVRSRATRRASVRRSASGAGARPSASSRARMKRSIGVRTQADSFTAGRSGRAGGMNDQWGSYSPPAAIHRFRRAFWSAESVFLACGGGITSSGSSEKIRSSMTLESGSPGTIDPDSTASSRTSSRRSAARWALSAPWQPRQFSTRIGRMSWLYETASAARTDAGTAASPRAATQKTLANRPENFVRERLIETSWSQTGLAGDASGAFSRKIPGCRRCAPPDDLQSTSFIYITRPSRWPFREKPGSPRIHSRGGLEGGGGGGTGIPGGGASSGWRSADHTARQPGQP